jgi:diguanylate cyclase (GGDEF)-like protein
VIVNSWHKAVEHTGFTSFTSTAMRRQLGEFTDQVIAVLLSEPFERRKARAIGSAMASMHYLSSDTLGRVQEVLARQLVEDLPDDQVIALQPRLAMLLAEIAVGFFEQVRDTMPLEQKQIKAALLSEHRQAEEALRESKDSLVEAQRIANLGHWDYDLVHGRLRWSDEIYRIFGVDKQVFETFEDYFKRVHPDDRELLKAMGEGALGGRPVSLEHRIVRPDGEVRVVQHRLQFIFDDTQIPVEGYIDRLDDEGKQFLSHMLCTASRHLGQLAVRPVRAVGTVQDITARKALEEQLKRQAFEDSLTNLPNRIVFLDRLKQALMRSKGQGARVQVLFLDLDNFKLVNDSLGHAAGDQLLLKVAARLKACVRSQDTLARFGGDEFAILLEDAVMGVGSATYVAKQIIKELQSSFFVGDQEVFVTASIGIASSIFWQDSPDDLLRQADIAMYRAKNRRKASYEVFKPSMDVRSLERLRLTNDLRRATERGEFVIRYQPIIELVTSKVVGVEALLRWKHSERGLLSPAEFIPLAEESGLIVPIGQWVIKKVCRQARLWQEQYFRDSPLIVSMNLSARELQHPGLMQEIAQALQESRVDPNGLELEITESAIMRNEEAVFTKLEDIKGLGVRLAIDDFGSGYSSLFHLNRLPIDTLKIDKSFIKGLREDPKAKSITTATIMLARALGLKVVAEGVETAEQLSQLRKLGCDLAQGYYFAKPLTHEEASALIATETVLYSTLQ